MSTKRVTGEKESETINVCPEELHLPPLTVTAIHPEKKKGMNAALNQYIYDVISCMVHYLQAADE